MVPNSVVNELWSCLSKARQNIQRTGDGESNLDLTTSVAASVVWTNRLKSVEAYLMYKFNIEQYIFLGM